ncbi:Malto-oligosyltrehalose trehalohydrolase [Rubellimicrobium mesophilum DSM 19309]|uniref:Malto-oligosyltrehalose trehalohydrolase n=2 Tax=Rubellimicrobium TaxID=295418 RepID=A0A017HKA4_9RHOB|nr:Malto-oligosyltrehalose trehalohydrolase [Rubellimicrobium mesophilum DSM 19309]
MIDNALYWLEEFHFDGLRLDAVHAIVDDSPEHLLDELARRVRGTVGRERHIHLILENEENEAHRLERTEDGRPRTYTAQWNDDAHHVLHVAATGEAAGYYGDYTGDTERLARALAEGFAFQGEMMPYRGGAAGRAQRSSAALGLRGLRAEPRPGRQPRLRRPDRPSGAVRSRARPRRSLPSPAPDPHALHGEEWAASQPFPFFCDFHDELGQAVREGRRGEFARFPELQDEEARSRIPDPIAEETFRSAKLDWTALSREPHAARLGHYQRLLATRRQQIVPRLGDTLHQSGTWEMLGEGAVRVVWPLGDGGKLALVANLSARIIERVDLGEGRVIWTEGDVDRERGTLGPWSVVWTIVTGEP